MSYSCWITSIEDSFRTTEGTEDVVEAGEEEVEMDAGVGEDISAKV